MLHKSYSRKSILRHNSSKVHLRSQVTSNLVLPSLPSKLGSLHSFLSIDEFRKNVSLIPEDSRFHSDGKSKKQTHRLYLTMNEDLSSTNKKEVNNGSILGGQEDQIDSVDERKKLLYDEHVINRQKAALNICKSIVDQVKQEFGYQDKADESEKSAEESVSSDASSFATKSLVKVVRDSEGFQEKLEKIRGFVHEKHLETCSTALKGKKNNYELLPGENEETKSHDTSFHRMSRIKEKPVKEESLMINGNLKDLFAVESIGSFKLSSASHSNTLPRVDPETYLQLLEKLLENPPKVKSIKYKKTFISVNKQCISLPDCSLDSRILSLLTSSFLYFKDLVKLDLSGNHFGDSSCAQLVSVLISSSPYLEYLDLSKTGSQIVTSGALTRMLTNTHCRVQTLRIDLNNFMDEGICCICVGLLNNFSVKFVNITSTGFELAGGLALAKVIRINRTLKGLALGMNKILGKPLREITRAMIVNNEIISLSVSGCKVADEDIKEFSHMLNSNSKLLQLDVSNNEITQRGLEHFKYGLCRNKTLFHLAISGNVALTLKVLERFKLSLSRCILVDICKEEDFLRTAEAKKFKMIEMLDRLVRL